MYTPCKDCTDREIGCHSSCDKYATYRAIIDEYKNATYGQRKAAGEYREYRRDLMIRVNKNQFRIKRSK